MEVLERSRSHVLRDASGAIVAMWDEGRWWTVDESEAFGIWSDGVVTNVVGYGSHSTGSPPTEAVMWSIPSPSGLAPLGIGLAWVVRRRRQTRS